ncbi:MAG: flagellar motor protein MotB [Peptostreptococcaceae bacterium]|jgi:chemotaxis protein MotB|nr:flagellar motor protein MotB [Peptostreptococcaceae bacterium]
MKKSNNLFTDNNEIEIEGIDSWLITYSDMITIILCFFILFFYYSEGQVSILSEVKDSLSTKVESLQKENKELKQDNEKLSSVLFDIKNIEEDLKTSNNDFVKKLKEKNMLDNIELKETKKGLLIRFKDNVLFTSASANISDFGLEILKEIGKDLNKINNKILVEGHTDNIPINSLKYSSNWELSSARAINVVNFLSKELDIDSSRFSVSGYGSTTPIADNKTKDGRAKNRRIEIVILNK